MLIRFAKLVTNRVGNWMALFIIAVPVSYKLGLKGWDCVPFLWACAWIYRGWLEHQTLKFTVVNHTIIPSSMDKEEVAKLVASQRSEIEET